MQVSGSLLPDIVTSDAMAAWSQLIGNCMKCGINAFINVVNPTEIYGINIKINQKPSSSIT